MYSAAVTRTTIDSHQWCIGPHNNEYSTSHESYKSTAEYVFTQCPAYGRLTACNGEQTSHLIFLLCCTPSHEI
jgi:hypothetical protein